MGVGLGRGVEIAVGPVEVSSEGFLGMRAFS